MFSRFPAGLITRIVVIFCSTLMFACSSTSNNALKSPALIDAPFPTYHQTVIETPEEIFALDNEALQFVHEVTEGKATDKGKLNAMVKAIFNKNQLALNYHLSANTTASQTFHSASANCLSLTILTYAMTQELGMKAQFQDVQIPEFWTRQAGSTLINRHVNLRVIPQSHKKTMLSNAPLIVDFDPQRGLKRFPVKFLNKQQMVSYFYTNKAADHLIDGDENAAYAYLKAAIQIDKTNESAWLNLGVLMSQKEMYDKAMQYYEHSLAIKPDYPTVYQNIALLYKRQGDEVKAQAKLAQLHKKRLKNPYYHMMLGDVAVEELRYRKAVKHYRKAISLNSNPHEFYFSLAQAYHGMGDVRNTKRALQNAKRKAGDTDLERQYASKISVLLASKF